MDYKIVEKPGFNIVGKGKDFDLKTFGKEGPAFWKQYVASQEYQTLCNLHRGIGGAKTAAPLMSVYYPKDAHNDSAFMEVLGIEAQAGVEYGEEFEIYQVPAASYAEFDCTYATSKKTNKTIYNHWLANSSYTRDGNKPDIAAYFPVPFKPMRDMFVRWWIPVKNKA